MAKIIAKTKEILIVVMVVSIIINSVTYLSDKLGRRLVFAAEAPFLAIETTEIISETVSIPYITAETTSGEIDEGEVVIVNDGKDGEKCIEYKITKINGEITRKDVIWETVNTDPVDAVKAIGIKEVDVVTGSYRRPYYGIVSSRFGTRGEKQHAGIDYAGREGDPVLAADGGTVSFAGVSGGYGNMVIIKHENDYETRYAHMSFAIVEAGQKVAKGDLIGAVGNTGNSTGPHLHFEVRIGGVPVNPEAYVKE